MPEKQGREPNFVERILVRYCRWPDHPMKMRLVRRILGRWLMPERGIVAEVTPQVKLYLHPRDWIEYLLLTTGQYEPLTLRFIESNLAPGDVSVLAGVNLGLHVIVAARAVGPVGKVIGVEPQPGALSRAAENITLNQVSSNVTLISAALGDRAQLMRMTWAAMDNAGAASILDESQEGLTVFIIPLQDLLRELRIQNVRLFLLDVQGFELRVLEGLKGGPTPELIVMEVDQSFIPRAGHTPRELLGKLSALGYDLFDLHGTAINLDHQTFDEANVVGVRQKITSVIWV